MALELSQARSVAAVVVACAASVNCTEMDRRDAFAFSRDVVCLRGVFVCRAPWGGHSDVCREWHGICVLLNAEVHWGGVRRTCRMHVKLVPCEVLCVGSCRLLEL